MTDQIRVKVAFVDDDKNTLEVCYIVDKGLDVSHLLNLADIKPLDTYSFANYSQTVTKDYILQNGDRIEVLRPLKIDPKGAP